MRFGTIALAALSALTAVHGQGLTPGGVVMSIEEITDLSSDTNDILMDIKGGNLFSIIPVRPLSWAIYLFVGRLMLMCECRKLSRA